MAIDPESLLLTLSGDLALIRQRLTDLEGSAATTARLGELADQLARLAAVVAELQPAAGDGDTTGPVWDWTTMDADQAAEAWALLLAWVDMVLLARYPPFFRTRQRGGTGSVWRPCWPMHPDVLDDVTMLYATWQHAYTDPAAVPTRAAEWRDRWLPGAYNRIVEALQACKDTHRDPFGDADLLGNRARATGTPEQQAKQAAFIQADIDNRPPGRP